MCYKLLARKPRQDKKTKINDNNSEHQPEKTKIKTIIQSTGRKRQELKTVIQSTGHQILKLVTPIRTGACKRRGERGARQDGRCVCVCIGGRHHCRVYVDTFLFAMTWTSDPERSGRELCVRCTETQERPYDICNHCDDSLFVPRGSL